MKSIYKLLSTLRDKRKLGKETDTEFECENAIAELLKQLGKYDEYLSTLIDYDS
jgi:hypothetical protein